MKSLARWVGPLLAATALSFSASTVLAQEASRPSLAEPSISADGREIAFASGGDIWTVPAEGGVARLLITDPSTASRPMWSPDGTQLAFQSTRNGASNIFILTLATGEVRRLTFTDAGEQLDGWSRDGKWIYFTSSANDVARQGDIFRVASAGGTPLEVSRERYLSEFQSAPSPDGTRVAIVARGISNTQWWRNGSSHIDESEIWLKGVAANAPYERLLAGGSRRAWPMWSPDGSALYYMSDQGGAENLYRLTPGSAAAAQRVTAFTGGRVLYPSIAATAGTIVFERDFRIWKLDPATGQAAPLTVTLRGAPAAAGEQRLNESSFRALALSPDGKKVAVIAHGEVFAASAKDGGAAQRISRTAGAESQPVWSPDSKKLLYVSEQGLNTRLVEYDFASGTERPVTEATSLDEAPVYSPDGKSVAYVHGSQELRVATLADGKPAKDTVLYSGAALAADVFSPPSWSPDGQWVAFVVTDPRSFTNVYVAPAAGGEARPVSFLANGNTGGRIAWAPDGKYLLFSTSQRSEDAKMVRIDLLPHTPKFREDTFRDLFKPSDTPDKPSVKPGTKPARPGAPASKTPEGAADKPADDAAPADGGSEAKGKKKPEPVKIVFEGIRERASILPLGLSVQDPVISPDGKTLIFAASTANQEGLYSYDLDELAKEPPTPQQLAASAKPKGDYAFTPDSKTVFYLEGGSIQSTALDGKPKPLAVSAEMVVSFDTEKQVVFDEAWSTLNRRFYDPKFHGKDWAALRTQWQPVIAGARTPDELRRAIGLMIGELNASHSGIGRPANGPGAAPGPRVGDLGLRFDREAYEAGKGLVVREVVALGPAAVEGAIKPGDILISVNGVLLAPGVNLDQLLLDQIGKRTVLKIAPGGDGARAREAVVRPVSPTVATGLLYRQWVNERRAYVEKISGGRLGYVHIPDMSDASLAQLYLDLDAQNQGRQGVVIDLRNNNGGYVNGYVMDVFTRKNFLTMTQRDQFGVPSRQALGQRALGLPTVLVINESSLSDAEDFTEGYRALGVGKVVGQPTAGWIIYTGPRTLIDGSVVRVPSVRIQTLSGEDMELHPRPVDVPVERPLGETLSGRDAQLEAAVKVLLGEEPKLP